MPTLLKHEYIKIQETYNLIAIYMCIDRPAMRLKSLQKKLEKTKRDKGSSGS